VLSNVRRHLASNGTIVLDLTDGDWMRKNFQPRSWEWVDESHLVCRERALSSDSDRLISREVVVHAEMGVLTDQFYAERLYSFDRITTSARKAGILRNSQPRRSRGGVQPRARSRHDGPPFVHHRQGAATRREAGLGAEVPPRRDRVLGGSRAFPTK
jgi:hypothetical protein